MGKSYKKTLAAVEAAPKENMTETDVIANAMLDKKANGVVALDLRGIGTAICDHFVICDAASAVQVSAIADNIEEQMWVRCHRHWKRCQGKENNFWIILDYTDIVVHIFQSEYRQFYRLEDLWADAPAKHYQD